MKRQLGITVLLFLVNSLLAQSVERVVFERGIDYINCQLTKISLSEQSGQPHLSDYKKQLINRANQLDPSNNTQVKRSFKDQLHFNNVKLIAKLKDVEDKTLDTEKLVSLYSQINVLLSK